MKNDEEFYELYKNTYNKVCDVVLTELNKIDCDISITAIIKYLSILIGKLIAAICTKIDGDTYLLKFSFLELAHYLEKQAMNKDTLELYTKWLKG